MALSKKLRDEICKKLGIKQAAFYNHVSAKATESGIVDRDIAGLLIAHELKIPVSKRRYEVSPTKIQALQECLGKQSKTVITTQLGNGPSRSQRKLSSKTVQLKRLLTFQNKYPDIFYQRLEREINLAYSNPELPNAVLMLSRKLIENLLYNLMQKQFRGVNIVLYFDTNHSRPHDFSILLDNLKQHKRDFSPDLHDSIDKFLILANSFRLKANANTHNVLEYLEKMGEVNKYKIKEMTQLLLNLIDNLPSS